MSEVENNQETNGTSNGEVPEIELIIKEEFMLENEFVENANENKSNIVTAAGVSLNDLDEKENILQSKLQLKQQQQQQQQHNQHTSKKGYKTINNEKQLTPCKDVLTKRHHDSTECGGHVLMLTHHDNQHFHFEYVTPKQDENLLQTASITEHTPAVQLNEKLDDRLSILPQRNRVPLSQNHHLTEKVIVNAEDGDSRSCSPASNLDFAAMVAEACDGIFEEIEKDLRAYNNDTINDDDETEVRSKTGNCSDLKEKRKKRAHNSEAVQLAVNAVLEGGMSLGEAAKQFNVVRSTISSRVAKYPKRIRRKSKKEIDELIHSKLMAGTQISEISRCLHVPKSTVHLHKTRLKNSGLLPAIWIRNGTKDVVDNGVQKRMMQAYRGHVVNGMSVRFAAEFYSLPLTTLWRFIKRKKNATTITAVNNEVSSKCAAAESSDGLKENTVNNATTAFEDLEIDENSDVEKEIMLPCTSSTCPSTLMTVFEKYENLEQSLINQLLE